jgi:transcriptional regulator with XRE-family HTH domain
MIPPSELNAAFGATLARLRKERGWTQEFLSFECELARNYISLLERGKSSPTLTTVALLAGALGLDVQRLIALTFEELRMRADVKATARSGRPA